MFTQKTKQSICTVAETCAQDLDYEMASSAETVAELALDANRLTVFGHPEADAEVGELVDEHGLDKVLAEAATFVPTA